VIFYWPKRLRVVVAELVVAVTEGVEGSLAAELFVTAKIPLVAGQVEEELLVLVVVLVDPYCYSTSFVSGSKGAGCAVATIRMAAITAVLASLTTAWVVLKSALTKASVALTA